MDNKIASKKLISKIAVSALYAYVLAALLLLALPASVQATDTSLPTAWSNFTWYPYLHDGNLIFDYETSDDPTNGGSAVQPADIDIASGAGAPGRGPGTEPSVLLAYYDGGTPGDAGYADDFYAFRLRLAADPQKAGDGYEQRHWQVLIDSDDDGYKEFVIDLNGKFEGSGADRLQVYYNNLNVNTCNNTDLVDQFIAANNGASQTFDHTHVVPATGGLDPAQVWLDSQIPVTVLRAGPAGAQLVFPSTPIRLFYGTSDSATDPLQKDLMLTFDFGNPVFSMVVSKNASVPSVDAAGDVITYTITVTNNGTMPLTGVTPNDPLLGALARGADSPGDGDNVLEVGESWVYSGSYAALQSDLDTNGGGDGHINNTVTVNSTEISPVTANPSVAVVYNPSLALIKTGAWNDDGDGLAEIGETISYTFTVTNNGTVTLHGVAISDPRFGRSDHYAGTACHAHLRSGSHGGRQLCSDSSRS